MLFAAVVLQDAYPLGPGSSLDYSGFPAVISTLPSDELSDVRLRSHSVQMDIVGNTVRVSSTTVYRNGSRERSRFYAIRVPRVRIGDERSGQAAFDIKATLDKKPFALRPERDRGIQEGSGNEVKYLNYLVAPINMAPNATYALRLNYTLPLGRGGYELKQRLVGYGFRTVSSPIEQLTFAIRYGADSVYQLPTLFPRGIAWEVGEKGAALRLENFELKEGSEPQLVPPPMVIAAFYPGGFDGSGTGNR